MRCAIRYVDMYIPSWWGRNGCRWFWMLCKNQDIYEIYRIASYHNINNLVLFHSFGVGRLTAGDSLRRSCLGQSPLRLRSAAMPYLTGREWRRAVALAATFAEAWWPDVEKAGPFWRHVLRPEDPCKSSGGLTKLVTQRRESVFRFPQTSSAAGSLSGCSVDLKHGHGLRKVPERSVQLNFQNVVWGGTHLTSASLFYQIISGNFYETRNVVVGAYRGSYSNKLNWLYLATKFQNRNNFPAKNCKTSIRA
jgi:hypothetical protein